MKKAITICILLAVLVLTGFARADFILYDNERLTVDSGHSNGYLFDASIADIVSGGSANRVYAYDSSTTNISGGGVNWDLFAYNSSTINISSGSIDSLSSYASSTTNLSGSGFINYLTSYNSSTTNISGGTIFSAFGVHDTSNVNISGGYLYALYIADCNTVNICGGTIRDMGASESSTTNIYGGSIYSLTAAGSSITTFYGQKFHYGEGLTLDGNRVLGNGILSCEWLDGTRCAVIIQNNPTATILCELISEPEPICTAYPTMDFNKDCKVDLQDFAIFSQSWLECNLEPQSACWE